LWRPDCRWPYPSEQFLQQPLSVDGGGLSIDFLAPILFHD
jgi:hypothetical protein